MVYYLILLNIFSQLLSSRQPEMSLTTLSKSVLVLHSAEKMFDLVDKVEDYPQFLPWYGRTEIIERQENELKARLYMDYMGVQQSFATHNHNRYPHEIKMDLLEGPFKSLQGTWQFTPLGENECHITFTLHYELIGLLARLISPVFSSVTNKLVQAFVDEANKRYG